MSARLALAAAVLALGTGCAKRSPDGMGETRVYVAAKVRTLDAQRPLARAVAVQGGRVLAVGTRDEALAAAGAGAHVVELPGATIVPGLVDAHAHLLSLGRSLSLVKLSDAKSAEECVARMQQAPQGSAQGDWLMGRGWDQNDWAVKEFPTRALLDAAFPTRPVFLSRVDGHAAWVNSEGLRRAGLTKATKDPEGGRFERDAQGELTGVLVDNAIDLVAAKIPQADDAQLLAWLRAGLARCAQVGLTGVHDAGMELRTFKLLQQLDAVGQLPLRLYVMADGQGPDADEFLGRGLYRGRHLELRAVKFLADGALGSRGAALHAPYSDDPKNRGLLLLSPEALAQKAKAFAEAGFQVGVHAIGDQANTVVIDVLAALEKARPGSRHRVEHVQVLRADDVPRLAASGLVASFQPTHATSDMPWAEARLGKDRARFAYAWRSVLDTGAKVAFGSDFPVEEPDPLLGLYAARTRQDAAGQPPGGWLPEQRVTGEEALAGFTTGAAWAGFAEDVRGRLAPGQDADFVALSVDPVDDAPAALLGAKVLLTVSDGREVFRP